MRSSSRTCWLVAGGPEHVLHRGKLVRVHDDRTGPTQGRKETLGHANPCIRDDFLSPQPRKAGRRRDVG